MVSKPKTERREHFKTSSGIDLPVDFSPANVETVDYERDLGNPGEFPFTRGIRSNMYRGRLWTMRQYAGYATRGRIQRPVQIFAVTGNYRAFSRFRSAHSNRFGF